MCCAKKCTNVCVCVFMVNMMRFVATLTGFVYNNFCTTSNAFHSRQKAAAAKTTKIAANARRAHQLVGKHTLLYTICALAEGSRHK